MKETQKDLSREQLAAIKRSKELGRLLQLEHPEIADIYRRGRSHPQIVEDLNLVNKYGVTHNVAVSAIFRALHGYEGEIGKEGYEGLITDSEELDRLRREHQLANSRRIGQLTYEKRKGVHGLTQKELVRASKKGNRALRVQGLGIYTLTKEQLQENGRRRAVKKGLTPWTDEERKRAYELSRSPEYQKGSLVNNKRIAEELNHEYHCDQKIRISRTVADKLCKYRRSLEYRAQEPN